MRKSTKNHTAPARLSALEIGMDVGAAAAVRAVGTEPSRNGDGRHTAQAPAAATPRPKRQRRPQRSKPPPTPRRVTAPQDSAPAPRGTRCVPSGLAAGIAQVREAQRCDEVEIGYEGFVPDDAHKTASYKEVAEHVKGIRWLVQDWIPYGLMSGVIGMAKAGKSSWVLGALVLPIITGTPFPFLEFGPRLSGPRKVLWCDTEGMMGAIVQKLIEWGVSDEHRDNLLTPYLDPRDYFSRVDLEDPGDVQRIKDVISQYKTPLMVVDSYRGAHKRDENSSQTDLVLRNVVEIAQETKVAPHVIHHTGKLKDGEDLNADNARGSNTFLAAVRSLVGVEDLSPRSDKPPRNPWRRVRVLLQSFAPNTAPHGFRFKADGIEFGASPERPRKETRKEGAKEWLQLRLAPDRWYESAEILGDALRFGFSANAVQRAREELGITTAAGNVRSRAGDGKYEWRLPAP